MRISDWSSDVCSSDLTAEDQTSADKGARLGPSKRVFIKTQQRSRKKCGSLLRAGAQASGDAAFILTLHTSCERNGTLTEGLTCLCVTLIPKQAASVSSGAMYGRCGASEAVCSAV